MLCSLHKGYDDLISQSRAGQLCQYWAIKAQQRFLLSFLGCVYTYLLGGANILTNSMKFFIGGLHFSHEAEAGYGER